VSTVAPPQTRGPLMTDVEVARLLKLEHPENESTRKWIRQHVPHKRRLGHNTVRWFEADVLAWVESTGTEG
jgi:predicted DNA-binding transcriptional regulator AlpA